MMLNSASTHPSASYSIQLFKKGPFGQTWKILVCSWITYSRN